MFKTLSESLYKILYSREFLKEYASGKVGKSKDQKFSSINRIFQVDKTVVSKEHKSLCRRNITVYLGIYRILLEEIW